MRIVQLCSVPYTGTNFTLKFLQAHKAIKHTVQLSSLTKTASWRQRVLSTDGEHIVDCGLRDDCVNLVWDHFTATGYRFPAMCALATAWPTVVPLRDPLLALCSRRHRKGWTDDDLIPCLLPWKDLAALDDWDPIYLRIDCPPEHRQPMLETVHARLNERFELNANFSVYSFLSWEPVNEAPDSPPYKQMYAQRDRRGLRAYVGSKAFDALCAHQRLLKPLLARKGYEDLLWWTP